MPLHPFSEREDIYMAFKRVTMQDIADACGLSRNTVSKIFNDRGAVPEATRDLVLQKARALGYLTGDEPNLAPRDRRAGTVALLSCHLPTEFHFCNFFVPAFAEQLSAYGYTLMVYKLTPEELQQRRLPARLSLEETAGLLAIEVFDRAYMEMMCGLGLPTIFVDAFAGAFQTVVQCDIVSMENVAGTMAVMNHIIGQGVKRLGFVGDITHCNSFYERWIGYSLAMSQAGLEIDHSLCIMEKNITPYESADWMYEQLIQKETLPEAFFCANDLLAIRLMTALKRLGLSIPEDILVAGFDGQPQAAVVEPALTTVRIPSDEIGRMAADMLCNRISNPGLPLTTVYVRTTPVFRRSTEKLTIEN